MPKGNTGVAKATLSYHDGRRFVAPSLIGVWQ